MSLWQNSELRHIQILLKQKNVVNVNFYLLVADINTNFPSYIYDFWGANLCLKLPHPWWWSSSFFFFFTLNFSLTLHFQNSGLYITYAFKGHRAKKMAIQNSYLFSRHVTFKAFILSKNHHISSDSTSFSSPWPIHEWRRVKKHYLKLNRKSCMPYPLRGC